jgi:SAM-dependent methyltransferase
MKNSTSFVGFYEANNISPVSQDISDLALHFQRRESLLRSVGIIPLLLKGKDLLEFGPGSGHNAVYLASLGPKKYELVDGNSKGVQETRAQLSDFSGSNIVVHHALFDSFQSRQKFDVVWAEGCLPHQSNPLPLLQHIASFTVAGGLLCVSCANGVSYLSETLRRLYRDRFYDCRGDVHVQVDQLKPFLEPHLRNLRGMSRPVEDWILDNIVQPLQDRRLLSIPEVIQCLDQGFDVMGSSPKMFTDWRWYKDIVGDDRGFNSGAIESYYKNNLNLLDYRYERPPHSIEFGKKLEAIGDQSWGLMCKVESGDGSAWDDLFDLMLELTMHIHCVAPETSAAILEITQLLKVGDPNQQLEHFPRWWGRGQQYISFIKKPIKS